MKIFKNKIKRWWKYITKGIYLILTAIILTGCAQAPTVVIKIRVPASLTNDILYNHLDGHYGRSLPIDATALRLECIERGKDVIMLVTKIRNKNQEMAAIRKQQE